MGPQGATGATGAAGAPGPIGPAGLSGVEGVTPPAAINVGPREHRDRHRGVPHRQSRHRRCFRAATTMYATASWPDAANSQWWHVSIYNPTAAAAPVTLYAVCAVAT